MRAWSEDKDNSTDNDNDKDKGKKESEPAPKIFSHLYSFPFYIVRDGFTYIPTLESRFSSEWVNETKKMVIVLL